MNKFNVCQSFLKRQGDRQTKFEKIVSFGDAISIQYTFTTKRNATKIIYINLYGPTFEKNPSRSILVDAYIRPKNTLESLDRLNKLLRAILPNFSYNGNTRPHYYMVSQMVEDLAKVDNTITLTEDIKV